MTTKTQTYRVCSECGRTLFSGQTACPQDPAAAVETRTMDLSTYRASYSLYGQHGRASRAQASGSVRYSPSNPERETPIKALARRIERETGLRCYPVRWDSDCVRSDRSVESSTYEITLVRSVPQRLGGGYNVMGSLWATVRR